LEGLKSASFSCIAALHWQSPLVESALHSVEDLAQAEQIVQPSEVIRRVRALANKTDTEKVPLDVNDVVKDEKTSDEVNAQTFCLVKSA